MTITDYKKIYEDIVSLSFDCDEFVSSENISEEEIEKSKFILAILDVLNDVPIARAEYVFNVTGADFDYDEFLSKLD